MNFELIFVKYLVTLEILEWLIKLFGKVSYIDEYGDVLEKEDFLIGRILPGRSRQVILTAKRTAYVEILGKKNWCFELTE